MNAAGDWLQARWYGAQEPNLVLRALAVCYGLGVRLRRAAYRRGWLRVHRAGAPVIVVGNITLGGSGKTPLVIALIEHLRLHGFQPGVISRGYGRASRGQRVVGAQTTAAEAGDEPVLIARRCGVPVVVDADRVAAARRILELGCTVIVADDGLQHYRLHRDLEIEVIDGVRGYGNARLLPAGPLREPASRPSDLRIRNGTDGLTGEWPGWWFHLAGDTLVGNQGRTQPLQTLRGKRVHALAGIGNPRRFFDSLRTHGLEPIEHPFPDHHAFRAADLQFGEALPIVMTEKDWVKCAAFAHADVWMLPVRAEFRAGFLDEVLKLLACKTGVRND